MNLGSLLTTILRKLSLLPPPCPHIWRPARTSRSAARYCDLCETVEELSEEMFYAYFGRISR